MVSPRDDDERQQEIAQLRATASNLAQCLQALQTRMDELEIGRKDHSPSEILPINHIDEHTIELNNRDEVGAQVNSSGGLGMGLGDPKVVMPRIVLPLRGGVVKKAILGL